jgi:hypothetical protein
MAEQDSASLLADQDMQVSDGKILRANPVIERNVRAWP